MRKKLTKLAVVATTASMLSAGLGSSILAAENTQITVAQEDSNTPPR